jgi:hypothetical protein
MTEEEFKNKYRASFLEAYAAMLRGGLKTQDIVALDTFVKIADEKAHDAWLKYIKDQD